MITADTITDEQTCKLLGRISPEDLEAATNWLRRCAKLEWWRLPDAKRDDVGLAILILEAVNNATRARCAEIPNERGVK